MFGCVSEWLHFYSIPYYVIFWIINGLMQSTGWPAMVAIMANWFGRSRLVNPEIDVGYFLIYLSLSSSLM